MIHTPDDYGLTEDQRGKKSERQIQAFTKSAFDFNSSVSIIFE